MEFHHTGVNSAKAPYFDTVDLKSDGRAEINEKQKVGYERK